MLLLIILCLLKESLCCRSSVVSEEESTKKYHPNETMFLGNLSGWGVPNTGGRKWKNFLEFYKNVSINEMSADNWENFYAMSKQEGFPKEWEGYGPGSPGVAPPPWAYIPGNYGRPDLCYQFPAVGHCDLKLERWAYNPEIRNCVLFTYSGCGANENNFLYKSSCQEACMRTPSAPCEPQEKIEFTDLISR